jgi:cytoskeleton protein RodZ
MSKFTRRRDLMNANTPETESKENGDGSIGENSGNDASIGSLLRASRNRRNEALSEVSSALRIRQVYLEAIENNQFDVLPGAIYAIGFIRTYAEYLGLDGEKVVRRYKTEASTEEKKTDLTFPSLVPEHGIPGGAIVMLGLVLAAIGYGSWYFVSSRNIFVTEQVPSVPEKLAAIVGEKPIATEPLKKAGDTPTAAVENLTKEPTEKLAQKSDEETGDETPADKAMNEVVAKAEKVAEKVEAVVSTTPVVAETAKIETPKPAVMPEVKVEPEAPKPILEVSAPKPESAPEPKIEPTPVAVENIEPKPVVETIAKPVMEPEAKPVVVEKVAPKPEPEVAALPKKEPEPTPAASPEPSATATPEPAASAAPSVDGSSRITLRAVTDSYIQVRDNDADQLLITRLLKQGQRYQVPNRTGLSLITGNAGALEILVDGTAVPSIGPVGAVRRNVVLEAEKLIDGSAVIE